MVKGATKSVSGDGKAPAKAPVKAPRAKAKSGATRAKKKPVAAVTALPLVEPHERRVAGTLGGRRLAVCSPKGGVGKTTTALRVAMALAGHFGLRVLVMDLDPSAGATRLLAPKLITDPPAGTREVFLSGAAVEDVAVATGWGVDLCAASNALSEVEAILPGRREREYVLRDALDKIPADRWDVVVLDCPPSHEQLPTNALTATDAVLAVVQPSLLSVAAVPELEAMVSSFKRRLNPLLEHWGYLYCAVPERERIAREMREVLRRHVSDRLWPIEVRADTRMRGSLKRQAEEGRAVDDYVRVAREVLRRFDALPKRVLSAN
ncbi:MAG: ParA family protein [Deltaproteobacteria bacterium]|nr:ParA family protein [Deltaproteobacteria bacterium]